MKSPELTQYRAAVAKIGGHWSKDELCLRCEEQVWIKKGIVGAWMTFERVFKMMTTSSVTDGKAVFLPKEIPVRALAQGEVSLQRFKEVATDSDGNVHICFKELLPQVEESKDLRIRDGLEL